MVLIAEATVTAKAALAATATLVSAAFAASTGERWLARRRRHEAAWTVALLLFGVAALALWVGVSRGWDLTTFRVFFLFGAVLNVPWLALGTIYLLLGVRWGDRVAAAVALLSTLAVGVMIAAPAKAPLPASGLPKGSEIFGILPRVLAAVASGVGATVVLVGAVWSAVRLLRGGRSIPGAGRLALGNLFIAVGTLVLGASGLGSGRLGQEGSFALTLAAGIAVLFVGFLIATAGGSAERAT
jgi:hypothetical protein